MCYKLRKHKDSCVLGEEEFNSVVNNQTLSVNLGAHTHARLTQRNYLENFPRMSSSR